MHEMGIKYSIANGGASIPRALYGQDSHYGAVISDNNWAFSSQFTVALPPRPVEARCLPPLRCVTVRHVGITIPTGFMPRDVAGLVQLRHIR